MDTQELLDHALVDEIVEIAITRAQPVRTIQDTAICGCPDLCDRDHDN
ncbi:MAG: hypothetical protein HY071_00065 [Chloroflexi bacterium]|nr:hypothetical protein [Chloroflexota bacterium]